MSDQLPEPHELVARVENLERDHDEWSYRYSWSRFVADFLNDLPGEIVVSFVLCSLLWTATGCVVVLVKSLRGL